MTIMRKLLFAAACFFLPCVAGAQEETTSAQNALETTPALTRKMPEHERWEEAYRAAGVPEQNLEKLRELDRSIYDAYRRGEPARFSEWREQRKRLLTPEQYRTVRQHLRDAGRTLEEEDRGQSAKDQETTTPAETDTPEGEDGEAFQGSE